MQVSSKAIVLSKIRYKDNDLIVKCFTERFGLKSFLLKNVLKTKKSKIRPAYFQPLSILEIEASFKESRSLHFIKEVKLSTSLNSIYTNVVKTTIVMFLSEILTNILNQEEENPELFNFLETSVKWFDENETYSNFHLIFLLELTKYLGFYPDIKMIKFKFFNLEEGKFQSNAGGQYCMEGENLTVFKQLLGTKFDVDKKLVLAVSQKQELLNMILLYFKLHLDDFKQPKSLAVLHQVFK